MAWSDAPRGRAHAAVAVPTAARAILRRPRREPGTLLLVIVVCAASLVLSSAPSFAGQVTDDGLHEALVDAPPAQAGIAVVIEDRLGQSSSGDSFADLRRRGEEYRTGLAPSIQQTLGATTYLVETPGFHPIDANGAPLYASLLQYPTVRFRFENDVWQRLTLAAGRMPARHASMRPSEAIGFPLTLSPGAPPDDSLLPYVELAMTAATAESLHLGLNDRIVLEASSTSGAAPSAFGSRSDIGHVIIELVGLFEVNDPADPVWFGDRRLDRPEIVRMGEAVLIGAAVLPAEDEDVYADLYRQSQLSQRELLNWTFTWRYHLDPARVNAGALGTIQRDIRNLEATRGSLGALSDDPKSSLVRTGLPGIINGVLERRRLFIVALALAATGLFALALALVGLISTMLVERRRAALLLMRSRGASARQILGAEAVDAALFCLPAAVAGLLLSRVLVDGPATIWSPAAALLAGGCALLVRVGAALPVVRPPLGELQREKPPRTRPSIQRIVLEGLVVVVAAVALLLLRRRGLDAGAANDGRLPFDPYLAAVPVLLGAAVGLLTLRLVPVPLMPLASVAVRGRGIVALLGLRRIRWRQAAGALPTIVIVVAVGLAVFALGLASSIGHAQSNDAWQTAGADYRLQVNPRDAPALDRVLRAGIVGVESWASATVLPDTPYRGANNAYQTVTLIAVDPEQYTRVVRGTPAERDFPAALRGDPPGEGAPVPVLAATSFLAANGLSVGDSVLLEPGNLDLNASIVGALPSFPGVTGQQFVLVASNHLAAVTQHENAALLPTMLYIRGDAGLSDELRAAAGEILIPDDFAIAARSDILAASRDSAFSLGISDGFRLTVLLAALYAALAIVIVQALSLAAHARDLVFLRTLGLSARQAFALSLVEHVPLTIIAGAIGALLGAGLVHLVEPGIPLAAFTSGGTPVAPQVPFWPSLVLTAAILLIVLLALLAFTLASWRARFDRLARAGA